MATRLKNSDILSSQDKQSQNNKKTFREFMLEFKPGPNNGDKVSHKVRLIGEPLGYYDFTAYTYDPDQLDPDGRPSKVPKEFPDADQKNSFTRIGHDDPEQCYWSKNGYIKSKKFAQNVIWRKEDGTSELMVLNKGNSVFKPLAEWQNTRLNEKIDDDLGDDFVTFLGGLVGRDVVITCTRDKAAPGKVKYTVEVRSKDTKLSKEDLELLKEGGVPSEEQMEEYRAEYEARRNSGEAHLPPFQEFFEWGPNLRNMFKYTPPSGQEEKKPEAKKPEAKTVKQKAVTAEIEDEDLELTPPPKTTKAKANSEVFTEVDDSEDDWGL